MPDGSPTLLRLPDHADVERKRESRECVECWETPAEDTRRQDTPIFAKRLVLEGASYPVPDTPGFGVEVDEAELREAEPFRFSEMPHLKRRDGSATNW
jgi:galactonate dehydratase